jgi:YegS/Rv2252/BmrU family lipid kinase
MIVNPRARLVGNRNWYDETLASLSRRFSVETQESGSASAATELARVYASRQAALVIAAGGDGTINLVARGLAGSDTTLGILPLGTANDLARELGVPRDLRQATEHLLDATPRRIDLVEANGVPYCTVGGLTLVSQSALLVNALKSRPRMRRLTNAFGSGVYRLAATANLLSGRQIRTRMQIEYVDERGAAHGLDVHAHALFVTNHRTLGGGLRLPVDASASDGVFELCYVPVRPRLSLTINFARLSAGRPLPPGVLETVRATQAMVRTDHDDTFVADGELLATGREFNLVIRPRSLSIL